MWENIDIRKGYSKETDWAYTDDRNKNSECLNHNRFHINQEDFQS